MAGTESTNMTNGSSTSASAVVVTARDIEFSNYDSSTGKWGNAVMTMMIEDANTPDNINLEVYDERVYAVFRNHYDHADTVRTSAEVDGMDFRVTISTPMVASGKYELYKVYGETSGREYATTSQFYFQVPGKVWDFANDIVDHDVELVSDWFNYGEVVTSDNVVHGFPTREDALRAAAGSSGGDVSVNGETISTNNIVSYKLTSMFTGDVTPVAGNAYGRFISGYNSLQNLDIVSSGLTAVRNSSATSYSTYTLFSTSYNQKFGFPSTIRVFDGWFRNLNNVYDKPIYMPDSVERINMVIADGGSGNSTFTSKIRISPNITERYGSNFYNMQKWAGSFESMSANVQLPDPQTTSERVLGFLTDWGKGLTNGTWTAPSTWTYIPTYWMYSAWGYPWLYGYSFTPYKVIIPEGITAIHSNSLMNTTITSVKLPSTLSTIQNTFSGLGGNTTSEYLKLDMSACTSITGLPDNFLVPCRLNVAELKLPPNLTTIGNNFIHADYMNGGHSYYTNWPVDEDNKKYFEIPEGVTSLGNNCCGGVFLNSAKLRLPSTLMSVGTGFGYIYAASRTSVLDLSQFTPEMFAESTQSFACYATSNYEARWKITVAPGTADAWAERFPNRTHEYNGNTYWTRYIEWVEKPTKYGYVFYETNYRDDNPTKGYVELQSMADFNKFANVNDSSDVAITVDTDDQGNTIELHFGNSSTSWQGTNINTITGFSIGTDITAIPDSFLRRYRYLKRLKWGGNETSIGSYVCYTAGQSIKASERPGSYDLANIPDTVATIGQYFFYNSNMNEEVHIPDLVTSLSIFLSQCFSFNQPITIPDSVTSIYSFLSQCTSFNQPVTIPDSVTSLSNFLTNCTSFNQPVTIPDSVTTISNFLSSCTSFNQSVTISDSATSLSYFLSACTSFNQPITIPDSVTEVRDFMINCRSFDQPISINNNVSIMGFLSGCTSFNSTVTVNNVGSHAGKQTSGFLAGCSSFNKPLDLSPFQGSNNFEVLGETIISYSPITRAACSSFNSQLILPTSVRQMQILYNGSAFNQPITFPAYTENTGIYSRMCYGWTSFNQPVTIPSSWCKTRWYNNASLFENCDSLTSAVTFDSTTVPSGADSGVIQKSFSTTDATAATYTTGVTFTGTGAQAWRGVLPDYDGTQTTPANTYRKINVA